ncbi:MAG: cupin domain-containing protein [Anaerolineae bacterium]|nr:cupin domain-containing protein [Anaerolineae bacterium]
MVAHEGEAHLIGNSFGATIKIRSAATASGVSVVEHTLLPGFLGAAPHKHSHEDEISYVLEGALTVEQNGEVTTIGPGAFVVKPRGMFHTFWNAGNEPLRFLEIIAPGTFASYFAELSALIPQDTPPDMGQILALGQRYGLEFDMSRVPELLARGLKLG